jgi:beta-mannosidase
MHIWDVWNQVDYDVYRSYQPRFVSEFGWQGPPAWSTLRRAMSDDPLTPESPGMLAHQKAHDGHTKLTHGLVRHLSVPDDMDSWHWAMSLNQARAVQTGVEYFRSLTPRCAGSIVWQLNDCWPVTSWAAIDGDGRRKPLFYALRHAHADRLLTVQPRGEHLAAVLVNDTPEDWTGVVRLTLRSLDGSVLHRAERAADVPAWSARETVVPAELAEPGKPATSVLEAQVGDRRAFWFFTEDRDSGLATAELEATATKTPMGFEVTIAAAALLRDVALLVDKVDPDAVVSDMLVTILPGETVTWAVQSAASVDPQSLLAPTVLRTANELVRCG